MEEHILSACIERLLHAAAGIQDIVRNSFSLRFVRFDYVRFGDLNKGLAR